MKKGLFTLGLIFILIGIILSSKDSIVSVYNKYFGSKNITLGSKNEYYRDYDFNFVQNTNSFSPNSYQDILNIYYTVVNAGKNSFTFYCPTEYKGCISDVEAISNDSDMLTDINNYVHPFNEFDNIETTYNSLGEVDLSVTYKYDSKSIEEINNKVDELYSKLVSSSNSEYDNIKSIHDYIINNTKYDSNRSDNNIVEYSSDSAYGPLYQGYALCSGYTEAMQLFLEKMHIKNFRVSSTDHIWNAVYIDGKWLNLDLTWDDPVMSDGSEELSHDYFLIDTNTLLNIEKTQHNFNMKHYSELKAA